MLKITDENLNLIREKTTWSYLKGVDASQPYCISNRIKLVIRIGIS